MLSQRSPSAGHAHWQQVLKHLCSPVNLHLDTPWMLNAALLPSRQFLDHLRLRPRRHAIGEHLAQ
jgi:hypothetical protein